MNMPKKYSEKEKQEIISAYQHRQPLADIGEKFGVALSTIYRWVNDKKECITEENMLLPMDIRNLLSLKERLEHILQIILLSNLLAEVPPRRRLDILCWRSAGRGRCAATSGRRCCPMIPCWRRPSLRKAPPRKPGPARYAAGPFSPMAGHGIAPPAAPRPQGSKSRGDICGNTGDDALAFNPGKPACHKAFRGRFGRGQYLFPSAPVFQK